MELLPSSSVVEQVAVNHFVVGSSPTWAAIDNLSNFDKFIGSCVHYSPSFFERSFFAFITKVLNFSRERNRLKTKKEPLES